MIPRLLKCGYLDGVNPAVLRDRAPNLMSSEHGREMCNEQLLGCLQRDEVEKETARFGLGEQI